MKDPLISKETAVLAKEKGFGVAICTCGGFPDCICDPDKERPTQSLLQNWLFVNHRMWIEILPLGADLDHGDYWNGRVFDLSIGRELIISIPHKGFGYPTDLIERLLKSALERIKSRV